jgi:MFS family permease
VMQLFHSGTFSAFGVRNEAMTPTSAPNPAAGRYPIALTMIALLLTGAILPSPIYLQYERTFGLTAGEISVVFAVYAASVIPSLLFLGGISDRIGRRRTMLIGVTLMALGSLVFAFSEGLVWLIIARILQGFALGMSLGAAIAAVTEWMAEAQRSHATQLVVIATAAGSALGALLGGVIGQYSPYPLLLPYLVHVALLVFVAIAIATVPSCPHVHDLQHTTVVAVPKAIRRPFAIAATQSFIGWGTSAIFLSLVPTFLAGTLDLRNLMVGAVVITLMQIGSASASFAGNALRNRTAIIIAMLLLGAGMWSLLLSVPTQAYALIGVAALLVGGGLGLSYLAGLRVVAQIAPPDHRAEVNSAFLVACYAGFSLPALAVGLAANRIGLPESFLASAIVLGAIAVTIMLIATERNLQAAPAGST